MKPSKIKVYFDVDNKWEMEVFFLKETSMPENFALGDVGLEQPISEQEMWDKVGPHAEAKFLNDLDIIIGDCKGGDLIDDGWDDPLAGSELDVNENSAGMGYVCDEEGYLSAIEGCCPVGPKGKSGPRGIDEEKMYPLILESLRKFSECQVDLSKDSACEVLADGITKKIIKYMWDTGED
jgi:hypothetical protein